VCEAEGRNKKHQNWDGVAAAVWREGEDETKTLHQKSKEDESFYFF
jgi:hypothetical protein